MYLRRLQLNNFRNFTKAALEFPPGISIILGHNGAGKTNLLEAAQFASCGRSFRTSREQEMMRAGEGFFRIEAEVEWNGTAQTRAVGYEQGSGIRNDNGGGPNWLPAGEVLCFSPDDLQLIKGAPAKRRRFLDDAIGRRRPAYIRNLLDYQKVLSQRNSFLQRARAGFVRLQDISPWDRQLAALGEKIYAARDEHCRVLAPHFQKAYREIAGGEEKTEVAYISQLEGFYENGELADNFVRALEDRWSEDLDRVTTGAGIHRDDVDFRLAGKSLKPYGSQGEQRAAVLALLLADRRMGMESGETPLLLLDDVMSELDPERRQSLLKSLPEEGGLTPQTIITAADAGLFSEKELEGACVFEVEAGVIRQAKAGSDVRL
ncbi:MAG: DNA replication and repair protein RecF [Actinobacteria bacterium]|nr:DNA replication and repair protein RecF [Actinomycetota bacterium]